jgi:hypothetical protein
LMMRSKISGSFSGTRGFAGTRLSTCGFAMGAALRFFGAAALGALAALCFFTARVLAAGFEAAALGAFFAPVLLRVRTKVLQSNVAMQRDEAGLVLPLSLPAIALHPKAAPS